MRSMVLEWKRDGNVDMIIALLKNDNDLCAFRS